MGNYSKFIIALLGTAVIALKQFTGLDLGGDFAQRIGDVVVSLVTAIGVYSVSNKPIVS